LISQEQSLNNVYQAKSWLRQWFFSPKINALLAHEYLFCPSFHNKQKLHH
jgi:hypothetical protein